MSNWPAIRELPNLAARETFGVPVVYTSQGLPAATLAAVFDRAATIITTDGEVEVTATQPILDLRLADLSVAPKQGDTLNVDGDDWLVAKVEPDGQGGAKLWLKLL